MPKTMLTVTSGDILPEDPWRVEDDKVCGHAGGVVYASAHVPGWQGEDGLLTWQQGDMVRWREERFDRRKNAQQEMKRGGGDLYIHERRMADMYIRFGLRKLFLEPSNYAFP